MDLCWCTITVGKLEESIKFYSEIIGLDISSRFSPHPGLEIVFLTDKKGNQIELIKHGDKPATSEKEGISLGFEVDSLEDVLSLVRSKDIAVLEGPFATPTVKFFFIKDPSGVTIQFVEKLSNSH